MTMITPSYLGETIEYSSLHACRSTLEDPTQSAKVVGVILYRAVSSQKRRTKRFTRNLLSTIASPMRVHRRGVLALALLSPRPGNEFVQPVLPSLHPL